MNSSKLTICLLAIPFALTSLACPTKIKQGDEEDGGSGTGGAMSASGGTAGSATGGKTGTGGGAGAGGDKGTGGAVSTGGVPGTGGAVSTGGTPGTGGIASTGGVTGTGGVVSTGGNPGTGGVVSTGGVTGTGGVVSTGGNPGTGGVVSTGGNPGTGGAPITCNPACGATQTCMGTQCLLVDGQTCSLASQCASKACTPFYVDLDGDGYGAGAAVGFCGTTAPVGYAAQSGDCCDTATNLAVAKLIHPGADFQTTPANVCNITWDYDCSGVIETSPQNTVCPSSPPCTDMVVNYDPSYCGGVETLSCACGQAGQTCSGSCGGHPAVTVKCK
ncbi:MAG TPA: hypothetical protein VHH90_10600 [Polyangia bacterium]|nr:hypothetical protein [Polyangia bacterium]